jgi:aspartyl/asparaginyl beta-hydroxylase (cupin superfamily)
MSVSATNPALAQQANAEGVAALRRGDAASAASAFARAVAADPHALPLYLNLAHAQRMAGDGAAERAALQAALNIDRLDFTAQLRMAQLLERMGEEVSALMAWGAVQQLAAQNAGLGAAALAEVAAGKAYCAALQERVAGRIAPALGSARAEWSAQEQRRIDAFLARALGQRPIYHNECAGLHYPFLPEDEYFDRDHFPWFDQLEAAAGTIKGELEALLAMPGDLLEPYVQMDEGGPETVWSALDRSYDWSVAYLWKYGRRIEPIQQRCPATAAVLDTLPLAHIPGRAPNVFFSLLKPHSHIPPHTGVTNSRAIIHLGLDIPPGCWFRVGGETREWVAGKAFAFDDTIEHEAFNGSDQLRAVLILDCWNPHLTKAECAAISSYYQVADETLGGTAVQ